MEGIYDIEDKVKRVYIGVFFDLGSLIMIVDILRVVRRLRNSLFSSDEEDFNYLII